MLASASSAPVGGAPDDGQGGRVVAGSANLTWRIRPTRRIRDPRGTKTSAQAIFSTLFSSGQYPRTLERHFTIGRYPGLDLEHAGWARPVRVEGGSEQWWVHRDTLGLLDQEWRPRTTLLSPFDNLICDRDRTERLWDLVYRNEIYVPKHKRRFGSYVMPVRRGSG